MEIRAMMTPEQIQFGMEAAGSPPQQGYLGQQQQQQQPPQQQGTPELGEGWGPPQPSGTPAAGFRQGKGVVRANMPPSSLQRGSYQSLQPGAMPAPTGQPF
jgi:hypothetical protein